jgi:hypothetical protein
MDRARLLVSAAPSHQDLEKIRTRLLDLNARNRLLSFRHATASSLRIVGANPSAVFNRLTDGDGLTFSPVPEPDSYVGEKPTAAEYAEEIELPTSFDLDDIDGTISSVTLVSG